MTPPTHPLVLGLDAATPPASVAVVRGTEILATLEGPFGRGTDAWILGATDAVLEEAEFDLGEMDALAATAGPGTFTGIRVGLATAAGLARGRDCPVAGISTLEALVATARSRALPRGPVLALVDARRGNLYAALALESDLEPARGPEIVAPEELADWLPEPHPVSVVGTGLETLPSDLAVRPLEHLPCVAAGAALATADRLRAASGPLPPARPVYVRRPDARPGASLLRRHRRKR